MISYHPVKCGGHGYCGNGEIIVLKSRLILLVAAFKESCNHAKIGGHRHCCSGDIMALFCHLIL